MERRYDVVFNNLIKNKDNGTIECEAEQIGLGIKKKKLMMYLLHLIILR